MPARSHDTVDEGLAALVVRAFELEPQQRLDETLGLTALDPVALHRLVDLVERRDQALPDRGEHVVGVPFDDRGEALQLLAGCVLTGRLHRAEHPFRALGHALHRLGVLRIDHPEFGLERGRVDLVARHVLRREGDQSLPEPRHGTGCCVHGLVERDVEAEVVARQRPLRFERVDVGDDEAEAGCVARREREVVAAERVLGEVSDHRARLHAEQRGRQEPEHVAHAGNSRHPRERCAREVRDVDRRVVVVAVLHRIAQRGCERLEHRAQRHQVEFDPAHGPDGRERGGERCGQAGLPDHQGLGRVARAPRTGRGQPSRDRGLGLSLERHPLARSGGQPPS